MNRRERELRERKAAGRGSIGEGEETSALTRAAETVGPRLLTDDERLGRLIDEGIAAIGDGHSQREPPWELVAGFKRRGKVAFEGLKRHPLFQGHSPGKALSRVRALRPNWFARWGLDPCEAEFAFDHAWERAKWGPGERPFADAVKRANKSPAPFRNADEMPRGFALFVAVLRELADADGEFFMSGERAASVLGVRPRDRSLREKQRVKKAGGRMLMRAEDLGLITLLEKGYSYGASGGKASRWRFNDRTYLDLT